MPSARRRAPLRFLAATLDTAGLGRLALVLAALIVLGAAGSLVTPLAGEEDLVAELVEARTPGLTAVAHGITTLGDLWFVLAAAVIVVVAMRRSPGAREAAVLLGAAIGGSMVVVTVLKLWIARPRPSVALVTSYSSAYPSGHAVRAAVVSGLVAWVAHRQLRRGWLRTAVIVVVVVLGLTISASRVHLGVHRPSEVVVGVLLGVLWLVAVLRTAQLPPPRARPTSGRPSGDGTDDAR